MAGGKLEPAIGLGAKAPLCHLMREYPASRRFAAMTTIPQKLPPARQPPITAGIAERPFDARMAPSVWSAGSLQLFPGRQGDRSRGRAGWRAFRGPVIQPCGIAGGSVGQFQRGRLVGAIDQEGTCARQLAPVGVAQWVQQFAERNLVLPIQRIGLRHVASRRRDQDWGRTRRRRSQRGISCHWLRYGRMRNPALRYRPYS